MGFPYGSLINLNRIVLGNIDGKFDEFGELDRMAKIDCNCIHIAIHHVSVECVTCC